VVTLSGQRVRTATIPASSSDEQWWWDGRDDSQRVVQDGDYRVQVDARDEHGNRIVGCTASVSVDNEAVRER
jgi:flagellar hook assembly protein FlgD